MNVASERVSHPLSVTSESLQVLAQWLKSDGTPTTRGQEPCRIIIDRYPEGLFSEAELEALLGVLQG
ncbi:hypothetical protein AWM79_15240 [Pseudomonas agarici]|uniref:Uncharacterized protein n=1 Tax=Pseudomonas agarici TaxID=46677 RepID=A0A0X1T3E4_PSEAA|nr:hypothetical protein AWM79_15240 [Pseudomonas agarici]SEL49256.1 hypothetical protein SAMN05216604_12014 [Pseudomonas agarici]